MNMILHDLKFACKSTGIIQLSEIFRGIYIGKEQGRKPGCKGFFPCEGLSPDDTEKCEYGKLLPNADQLLNNWQA